MESFAVIEKRALQRHGLDALQARRPLSLSAAELLKVGDDRWLSMMTRRIFQAGFVWRVVDQKWDHFEQAFFAFDTGRCLTAPPDYYDDAMGNSGLIRNRQKLATIRTNAELIDDLASEHGSFSRFIADWPGTDSIGLWDLLARRGARLGGRTGPMVLRGIGKDTFILSTDVCAALIHAGVVTRAPTSKKDRAAVQQAFNEWQAESGLPLAAISLTLACSIDG